MDAIVSPNTTCPVENGSVAECRSFFRVCVTHVPRLLSYFTSFRRRLDPNTPSCSFGLLLLNGSSLTAGAHIEENFKFNFAWPVTIFKI